MSILNLIACSNKWDKASQIILQTLEERYDEEFIIDSMGGSWGTSDDSTLKAYVYPVNNKQKRFQVQIKKDFSEVTDTYMNFLLAEKLENELYTTFNEIYSNITIDVRLSDLPTKDGGKEINLKKYIEERNALEFVIKLFVNLDKGIFNKSIEVVNIIDLIQRYNKLDYKDTLFDIYYVDSNLFKTIPDEVEMIDNTYKYYTSQDGLINHLLIVMENDNWNNQDLIMSKFMY